MSITSLEVRLKLLHVCVNKLWLQYGSVRHAILYGSVRHARQGEQE